jgi:hypothetical protein
MSLPAAFLPYFSVRLFTSDGLPAAGWKLQFDAAGTSTPQDTFAQSDLDPLSANTNPIVADAEGTFGPIYISPTGYKVTVLDENDVVQFTQDDVSDPGWTFFGTFGTQQSSGSKDQSDGYTVTNDDALVTMKDNVATDAAVNLQPAADRLGLPLIIKNLGTSTVSVQPNGSETIDGVAAAYVLAAFATPDAPTITLVPTTGGYFIASSHAL